MAERLGRAVLLFAAIARGASGIEGTVTDPRGAPVAGARVTLAAAGSSRSTRTDGAGRFAFPAGDATGATLTVEATGFANASRALLSILGPEPLRIVLTPAAYSETVTITATRAPTRLSESAASAVVLSSEDLDSAAALPLDAVLRQVPGFTLFRRSDSRTANPTTQGVSLRGVGGSAASRAVVLDDGVPLNDPFGGWIEWGRIVRGAVERVEVLRGGASELYGGSALIGAVNVVRRDPADSELSFESSYGSERAGDAFVFLSGRSGAWAARLGAEAFRTDGYVLVPADLRGAVDTPADSRHAAGELTVERRDPEGPRLFIRGSVFDESRGNGTPLQTNDTRLWQVAAGADGSSGPGAFSIRVHGSEELYHQTFSAISADRSEERLTRRQEVPSSAAGFSGQWVEERGAHRLVAGVDAREVTGESDEVVFANGGESVADAGGRQLTGALFAEDLVRIAPRVSLTLGARFDGWRNFDASRTAGPAGGSPATQPLQSRTETAFSPRVAVLYQATGAVGLTASAYRSFRAPTLNELYRSFRLGNVVTLANENLSAERLTGGEVGALVSFLSGRISGRGTLFWEEVSDAVSNVTLSSTPSLITRQRRNLGLTRSRGAELDLEGRLSSALTVSAGYLFADARVERFSADPALEGLRIPQVPKHQASLQLRFDPRGRARAAVSVRTVGAQFEDDANALPLAGYTTLDAFVGARVVAGVEAFVAGENLTGHRYAVGRTPIPTLGPPRLVRGGVRVRLGE